MAWQDNFNNADDLYAQRLTGNGGAVFSPTLVHSPTTNTQQATAVAFSDVDHNYLVVWEDGRTYSNRPDIYGRIFTTTDQPITTEFTIEAARRSYETPDVVFDPNSGNFVVVWTRETGTATQRDIRAQFVTVTGTLGTSIDIAA